MKAIIVRKPGPVEGLEYAEAPKPEPKRGEILVRVRASSVTRGDVALRAMPRAVLVPVGLVFGFKPMKITGVEFAGVVEALGPGATRFKVGDEVFGTATGLASGGNAEYLCVPERRKMGVVGLKPAALSFEEAAVLPVGGMTARQILARASLGPGMSILVHGASGSVGSYAVQLAKLLGASVTAVAGAANQELLRSLGADRVIDYGKEDFTANGLRYDAIFDAVGKLKRSRCSGSLKPGGTYLTVKAPTRETEEDLEALSRLAAEGSLKPVIDRVFSLQEVPEAHRHVEGGHKRGNVAVRVA
ncbi:MAG: NAD(P)-dependent alcohol dehydrogenase [Spirochaetaceae bacterium]|nr:NAD(P)-dependent alcohol dehydrogenase [Spirochaetaceae bacterium]